MLWIYASLKAAHGVKLGETVSFVLTGALVTYWSRGFLSCNAFNLLSVSSHHLSGAGSPTLGKDSTPPWVQAAIWLRELLGSIEQQQDAVLVVPPAAPPAHIVRTGRK